MMVNLVVMAIYLRLEMGVIMLVVIVLCWTYITYNRKKIKKEINDRKAKESARK
jgi:heme exporter protein D